MRGSSIARLLGAGVGAFALAAAVAGIAGAANKHAHGTLPSKLPPGVGVITLTTGTLPTGCTAFAGDMIVPMTGNAVMHTSGNKTGAWFTETLTASAALETPGGTIVAWGHETVWDGGALNQLFIPGKTTLVTTFTTNFQGKMVTGGAGVTIHGNGGTTSIDATVALVYTTGAHTTVLTITTPGVVVSSHFNAHC